MSEQFLTREAVGELVPHKGKMLLLDRVVRYSFDDISITTEIDISQDNLFYEDDLGGVPTWIAMEYMGQSIAALSGIFGRIRGEKPKVGFIMSISNFKAHVPVFHAGDTVRVEVHQVVRMDMAVTFEGFVMVGGVKAIEATINTIEVPDPKAMLGLK